MGASAPGLGELGPYRLVEHLGTGAMGTVYRAEVERSTVALKLIHPHLLERRGFFRRFQQEAAAGRRVAHPNVVQTHHCDLLVVEGIARCFLVMEYVEGQTLRELLGELDVVPEVLVREIGRQVASGLSAIHDAGIVHRDLKPENVLITDDHQIRIMDLGVARLDEDTRSPAEEGQFVGSLAYAAPEQFGTGSVTAGADLYGLGVLLYELATGTNPFRHPDARAVVRAHLETPPPEPRTRNVQVSAFLSEVVSTLLAKQSRDRFSSALAVAEVLAAGTRSDWWGERERAVMARSRGLPQIPVRRETVLCGREEDLAHLRRLWGRARDGQGNALLLEGEAGIGKTRLVDAFLRELAVEDVRVLYGSYPPSGGMGGISDALLDHLGRTGLEESLREHLATSPTLVPALAALLKHEVLPPDVPSLEGDVLHAALVQVMRSVASDRPLLWVVEDLHFADADSHALVLSLARAVAGHRILLLLTTRPGLPAETLGRFGQLEDLQRTSLGRLGARDVVLLLRDALRTERLVEKLAPEIAVKSDGVPFFVHEMIRGLKGGQFISELPDGSYIESSAIEAIEVPSAVRDLVAVRLKDLSRKERNLLDVAAVLGFTFDADLVARAMDMPRVRALQHLASIERRSGVVRASGPAYCFDHHQVQEVVCDALPKGLLAEYHTLLAEAFCTREELEGSALDETDGEAAAFAADHHLRGRRPEAARPYVLPGLEHLRRSYRAVAALDLARRALRIPGLLRGPDRVRVLLDAAARSNLLGRREDERKAIDEARHEVEGLRDTSLSARVSLALGRNLLATSSFEDAEAAFDQAIVQARDAGDRRLEAESHVARAQASARRHRLEDALDHLERGRALADACGDLALQGRVNAGFGAVLHKGGRYAEAHRWFERQLAAARRSDHRVGVMSATLNLGRAAGVQGREDEATKRFRGALALAREIGHRQDEATALGCLASGYERRGRHEEAAEGYARALEIAREIGDRQKLASHSRSLGCNHLDLGRFEEARDHLVRALAISRDVGDDWGIGLALLSLVEVAEYDGDPEGAHRLCHEAVAALRKRGGPWAKCWAHLIQGGVEREAGNTEAATAHFERALILARDIREPSVLLDATVGRALLPGGDVQAAVALWEDVGKNADHSARMGTSFRLWKATGDREYLREAHRLLMESCDHLSPENRRSRLESRPPCRDIVAAWEAERAGKSASGEKA